MDLSTNQRWALLLIISGYLVLAIVYALSTPPLEASDEYKHYPVVQYVQTQGKYPVLDPDKPGLWLQEGAQAPLYYFIMAGLTAWIDSSDLEEIHQINPHAFVGNPNQIMNKNLILHQPEREAFPWQGSVLAIYLIRLATIAFGVGTILVTTRLGNLLFNPLVGLLAAALTAFNPMFLFVHAAVNNDALSIFLGSVGLYLLVTLWRDAPDPHRSWPRYLGLGLILGLGLLTKLSLVGLLLLTGLALALLSWHHKKWGYLIIGGLIVLLVALAVAAPWYVRNTRVYGDPTAMGVFIEVQGTRENPITWPDWVGEFGTFYRSFWGLFGGVNVAAPSAFYWIYNAVFVAGIAGFVLWLWRWRKTSSKSEDVAKGTKSGEQINTLSQMLLNSGLWLLVAWVSLILILLIRWNIISPAFQGRLLFPAISALNVLLGLGLLSWVRAARQRSLARLVALLAFLMAAALPWITIRPAYTFPEPLTSVPEGAQFGPIHFPIGDGEIQLVGVEVPPGQSVAPGGDPIEVILYWVASQPIDRDLLSAVNILGRSSQSVGHVNRYPAGGMVPTSQWEAGQIWRDVYRLFSSAEATGPTRLDIRAALYDPVQKSDVPAYSPNGLPIDLLLVGEARLEGNQQELPVTNELDVALADGIRLHGYDLNKESPSPGESLELTLFWQATATPAQDYTVFVHLLDSTGNQVAGADSPPVNGDYPTTLWHAGEQILDEHTMLIPADLPPGEYSLAVGMYNPDSGARVPLVEGTGDTIQWTLVVKAAG